MEFKGLWPLLILFLLYLPQLLKSSQPKKYEYPVIPDKAIPPEIKTPPVAIKAAPVKVTGGHPPGSVVKEKADNKASPERSESSLWQNKLDQSMILNGIIFAEILEPPRALRPLRRQGKRR